LVIGQSSAAENSPPARRSILVPDIHARRLPHYYAIGRPMFITWRLHGSLPANRYFPQAITSGPAFVAMDHLLDNARAGPLYLCQQEIAARERELKHYELHAFVVMANHVHLLITHWCKFHV